MNCNKFASVLFFLLITFHQSPASTRYDFDGDGKTDPTVIFPVAQINWYSQKSTGGVSIVSWGYSPLDGSYSDWSAAADYDGDGKTDIAVWREATPQPGFPFGQQAYFYILYSGTGTYTVVPWGRSRNDNYADFPVKGDFDGDGTDDVAISRQIVTGGNQRYYYVLQSRDGTRIEQFGISGDNSVIADYDGDGKADLAVARPTCFVEFTCQYDFIIRRSSDLTLQVRRFGYVRPDYVMPNGDFDGDGKADIAVWGGNSQGGGNGVWSWIRSSDNVTESVRWGFNEFTDGTAQGDYDGDGRTDLAIYRRNTFGDCNIPSYFWIRGSTMGTQVIQWGTCHTHPGYNH